MDWLFGKTEDFKAEEYDAVYRTLTPSRKERVDRYKKEDDRLRSLLGELLLRRLLEQMGEKAKLISEPNGRPSLEDSRLFVSISHSDDAAVCAVSEDSIGIDIEKIKPVKACLADRICVEAEMEYINRKAEFATERFFEIWTAKEAYFKKCGTGITDFKSVDTLELDKIFIRKENFIICII